MKRFILLLLSCLGMYVASAQKESADKHYYLYEYAKAIPEYEKYLAGHPDDYQAWKQLSDAYYKTNDIDKAVGSYMRLINMPQADNKDLLQLIQVLRMKGQQQDAQRYALLYRQKVPGQLADNLVYAIDHPMEFNGTRQLSLQNISAKLPASVVSVQKWKDQLLVTAEGGKGEKSKWTGRSYNRLFLSNESFNDLQPFAGDIMQRYDNGTPCFNSLKNQMYFTTVNENALKETDVNTYKLKIVSSIYDNGKWAAVNDFSYNDIACNTAYPALSKDGKYLIFSSDRQGGKGGMDLYYCEQNGNGWSQPVNMTALNTEGNEVFPSFDTEGELWFSSNGLPGMGGLDIFHVSFTNGNTGKAFNAQSPLNSSFDDYGLFSDDQLRSGYLISNREGDKRIDNVYRFEAKTSPLPAQPATKSLQVIVLDKYTQIPLPYAKVQILKDGEIFQKGMTDEKGMVQLEEVPKGNYTIKGELSDITTTSATIGTEDFGGTDNIITRTLLHNDPRFTLKGIVINSSTHQPVEGVEVTCFNTTMNFKKKETTKADGIFLFQLEQHSDFTVNGRKAKWVSSEVIEESTKGLDRSKEIFVKLTLKMDEPKVNQSIRLDRIYYDYDKAGIRPKAAEELDRVVQLMNDYPDMKIELSSHTDARGSDNYNMDLSQRRADAAVQYIVSKGIPNGRIVAKGYGETKLLNRCGNGISCSEEEHQLNRRTEFKIISCESCPK